jgi:hypothetical protein
MKKSWLVLLLMGLGLGRVAAQRGYFNQTELGLLVTNQPGVLGNNPAAASLHTTNGYRFGPGLAVGLGTGLDAYEGRLLLPLALAVTGDVGGSTRKVVPFYRFSVGHGFDITRRPEPEPNLWRGWFPPDQTSGQSGGLLVQPSVGLKVRTGAAGAFTLQMGYRWQAINSYTEQATWRTDQRIVLRRLWLALGFAF